MTKKRHAMTAAEAEKINADLDKLNDDNDYDDME